MPDRLTNVSADGERFLALPPARGPQLQQITIFDRKGDVLQKVGDPGLYGGPAFSPDGTRLLVSKTDQQKAQADLWIIELASGKAMQLTKGSYPKVSPIWSRDGKYIYYSSFRAGDFPVYRRLSDGTGDEEFIEMPTQLSNASGLTDVCVVARFDEPAGQVLGLNWIEFRE